MKLLIVGYPGTLAKRLIATVRKADWEVYLLIGKTGTATKPAKVFEQFLFPYDSESIRDVVDSVSPDVVLFMGLYVNCFDWSDLQQTTMAYIAGLVNLLNACDSMLGMRFFYLSSQEVFCPTQGEVDETAQPKPLHPRGLLLEQGEQLCLERRKLRGLDATVIRLDHPYMLLESGDEYKDVFECMCVDACANGEIRYSGVEQRFSGLYLTDAAEGVYRIMAAESRQHAIYHLSCDNLITERELAKRISAELNDAITLTETPPAEGTIEGTLHLTCDNAKREFGFRAWYNYDETLPLLVKHTRKNLGKLVPDAEQLRMRRLPRIRKRLHDILGYAKPFLLNILGVAAAAWLRGVLERGGYNDNIDVFLLYSLLFSGLYGKQQAVFASVLSVAYVFLSAEHIFDLMINYNTYIWVAEVFIASMLVGHLRDTLETIKVETEEEVTAVSAKLREMNAINESNKRIKLVYERRLIEYNGSLGKLYKVTAELNALQPGEVLFSAVKSIAEVMETKDVAIYTVANDRYCRLFSATSDIARQMGRSIAYPELTDLYEAVMQRRVFINKKLDPSLPLMANGVFDGDKLTLLIMIWGLKLESLSLYQANQLSILCFLIMLSLNHASAYLKALERDRYVADTRLLEPDAFTELLSLYSKARSQHLVEYTLLRIPGDERTPAQINDVLKTCTRMTDILGLRVGGDVCVLLPNTGDADSPIVIERIRKAGLPCDVAGTEA